LTFLLAGALIVTITGFLLLIDRKDRRAHAEREQQRQETQRLLQRIQAPELAVVQHDIQQATPAPQPPVVDDDDGFWRALEQRENAAIGLG